MSSQIRAVGKKLVFASSLLVLAHCGGDSGNQLAGEPEDLSSPEQPGNDGSPSGEDPGDDPADPSSNLITVTGRVGSLAIDSTSPVTIQARVIEEDGSRGEVIASTQMGAAGAFTLQIDPSPRPVEFAAVPAAGGLLGEAPAVVRTRLLDLSDGLDIGINVMTEMAVVRQERLLTESVDFNDAYRQALAETRAATGIGSIEGAPASSDQINDELDTDRARGLLFLQGLGRFAESLGADQAEFLERWLSDFADGSINGKSGDTPLTVADQPLFLERDYDRVLREKMKGYIADQDQTRLNFNIIPKLDANPASTIQFIDPSEWADFRPADPEYFEHWLEIAPGAGMVSVYGSLDDCLGPFKIRRVNQFGRPTSTGPSLPLKLSGTHGQAGTYHSDLDCDDEGLAEIEIAAGQSQTEDLYFKPGTFAPMSMMIYVQSIDVEKVETAFMYLDAKIDGQPIAHMLHIAIINDRDLYASRQHSYIGDAVTPLARETCIPVVAELFRGFGAPAIRPDSVTLNFINNSAIQAPATSDSNGIKYYSDPDCDTPLVGATGITIPAMNTHQFFYLYIPSDYARNWPFAPNGFQLSWVLTPTTVTASPGPGSTWHYAVPE